MGQATFYWRPGNAFQESGGPIFQLLFDPCFGATWAHSFLLTGAANWTFKGFCGIPGFTTSGNQVHWGSLL